MCMGATGAPDHGLVVVLHGRGSTAAEMKAMTRLDELAASYGFAVVYPDAVGGRWGDDTFVTAERPTGDEDLTYLDQLIDTLRADVRISDGPVAIVGFSNGASMAMRYTAQRPGETYALVSVAGQLPRDPAVHPSERVPLLQIHGTGDPLRSFDDGVPEPAVRSADGPTPTLPTPATLNAFVTLASGPLDHTVEESDNDGTDSTTLRTERWADDEGTVLVQHTIVGGGHRWPSVHVDPYTDQPFGAPSNDVDASAEAIEFVVGRVRAVNPHHSQCA
jgi:polyhydroxybutyrate depolymerase